MARPQKANKEAIREFEATIAFVEEVLEDVPSFISFLKGQAKPYLAGLHAQLIWFYLRKNPEYVNFWNESKSLKGRARFLAAQQWGMNKLIDPTLLLVDDTIIFRKIFPSIVGYSDVTDPYEKLIQKIANETKKLARERAFGNYTEVLIPHNCPPEAVITLLEKRIFNKRNTTPPLNRNEVDNLLLNIPCFYSTGVPDALKNLSNLVDKFPSPPTDLKDFLKVRKKRFKEISKFSPHIFLAH